MGSSLLCNFKQKKLGSPGPESTKMMSRMGSTHKLLEKEIREDYLTTAKKKLPEPNQLNTTKSECKKQKLSSSLHIPSSSLQIPSKQASSKEEKK
jgi:hypothetical protein